MKVGIALSGGVDSAVALYLLKKQGYELHAYHIKTVPDKIFFEKKITHKVCCSPSDTYDAALIAKKFQVPFKIVDLKEEFEKTVINYFLKEYENARTPNPCYFCNRWIKFGILLEIMKEDGMEFFASGHYARVENGKLLRALDKEKDQSYFLASIRKEIMPYLIFPNGEYTKDQIREIAKKVGIHVHEKKESQDLCFIPDGNIKAFLEEKGLIFEEGDIVDEEGNVVGKHEGLPIYTIGQRKLGLSLGKRYYVYKKEINKNRIIIASKEKLMNKKFLVSNLNLLIDVSKTFEAQVKVRKKFKEVKAQVHIKDKNKAEVNAYEPIFAITPGQIAVFYNNDLVIGGGVIEKVLE